MKHALLFLTVLITLSCTQQKESLYSTPIQSFIINAGTTNTITTATGIKITIPAGSLSNKDGSAPTSPITVEIKEITKRSEMILNDISTVANNRLIESFGMFHISATSNNQELEVKSGSSLTAEINQALPAAGTFYGFENNNIIEWKPDSVPPASPARLESTPGGATELEGDAAVLDPRDSTYTIITFNHLDWINCDRFVRENNNAPLIITTNLENSRACIVFSDIKSVLISGSDSLNRIITSPIPVGYNVRVLIIATENDKYYYGDQQLVTTANNSINIEAKEISRTDLLKAIEKADSSN